MIKNIVDAAMCSSYVNSVHFSIYFLSIHCFSTFSKHPHCPLPAPDNAWWFRSCGAKFEFWAFICFLLFSPFFTSRRRSVRSSLFSTAINQCLWSGVGSEPLWQSQESRQTWSVFSNTIPSVSFASTMNFCPTMWWRLQRENEQKCRSGEENLLLSLSPKSVRCLF